MDAVALAALLLSPGIACLVVGFGLQLRAGRRSATPSAWAGRFGQIGIGLLSLIPGVYFTLGPVLGALKWPLIIAGAVELVLGIALLDVLRRSRKRPPPPGPNIG